MAKFTTTIEGRIESVIQTKLTTHRAYKKECKVESTMKRGKGREYLRPVGPLYVETTMDSHTVREGQHTDPCSSCLYVSNLFFWLCLVSSTESLAWLENFARSARIVFTWA